MNEDLAFLSRRLPPGVRIAVIGGTSLRSPDSRPTCELIGRRLASCAGLLLLTGGVGGVGETVGRAFHDARGRDDESVIHILPHGHAPRDYGQTLFAGADMHERRDVLGRLAGLYVAIEGGPGTADEASIALARGAVVVPVGRSGGCSTQLHSRVERPSFASQPAWQALGAPTSTPQEVAHSVLAIIEGYLAALPGAKPLEQG